MTTELDTTGPQARSREAVLRAVIHALEQVITGELAAVDESTRLFEELGLDSTMALDLLMHLEDDLDIVVDAETLETSDFVTVGSLVAFAIRASGG
jgi:acyl carrier protein